MARWRSVRVTRTPRQLFPFWKQVQSNWSVTAEGLRPAQLIDVGGMGNGRSCFGESRLQAVMLNESLARIGAVFFILPTLPRMRHGRYCSSADCRQIWPVLSGQPFAHHLPPMAFSLISCNWVYHVIPF